MEHYKDFLLYQFHQIATYLKHFTPRQYVLFIIGITVVLLIAKIREIKEYKNQHPPALKPLKPRLTSSDIQAIAGGDVMITQLDLARAFIEMEKKSLAREILNDVKAKGTVAQQQEAQQLIAELSNIYP